MFKRLVEVFTAGRPLCDHNTPFIYAFVKDS
jgi:hypothetical protein